jgi:HEAT repeat protein
MARKSSKKETSKRHTSIPAKPNRPAESPKKAAETTTPLPAIPAIAQPESTPTKVAAAQKIKSSADPAVVLANIAALRNADADVARDAATALGRLGDASAVEPLVEALSDHSGYFHSVVRAAAASSLGELRDPRAFQPLVNAVRDTMAEASAEAVRALAAMGDPRAVAVLIDIVRNPSGYFLSTVRLAAVVGLKQLGGQPAAAELLRIAHNASEDSVIRNAAANGL